MSDENRQAEKTSEGIKAKFGGLDFGAVIAKLKDPEKRFSLDGKASRGEYWATFLLLSFPLALLSGGLLSVALFSDLSDMGKLISSFAGEGTSMALGLSFPILASAFFTIANLMMFPVTVRRLRDANICVSLAAIMTSAVVFFAVAAVFCPWLVCGSVLIVLAPGILPSKTGATDTQAAGGAAKAKMCFLAAVLFVLAATMSGLATFYLIIRYKLEKGLGDGAFGGGSGSTSMGTASQGKTLNERELTDMVKRGQKLIMGIIQANIDRQGKAGPLWPRSYRDGEYDSDDVSSKAYTSAADYFNALFDMDHYGTPKWNPAVDRDLLRTLGKDVVANGKINPNGLDWCIAANVRDETPDNMPVLISANVNPANLRDARALVVVRKSGRTDLIKAPSYDAVYKGTLDDVGRYLEHPIVWLTPTGVVKPVGPGEDYKDFSDDEDDDDDDGDPKNDCKACIRNVEEAVLMYCLKYGGKYPESLDVLTERRDGEDPLLVGKPVDPWGTKLMYERNGKKRPMIRSAGPDGVFYTDDDISNLKRR